MQRLIARTAVTLTLVAGCAPPLERKAPSKSPAQTPVAVRELLALMRDRLLLMHDVARWKWNAGRPVADLARERALLSDIAAKARADGLDPRYARAFFAAQIAASRMVQEADFQRWKSERRGPFADVPDLASELRPKIDQLGDALLAALADAQPLLDADDVQRALPNDARQIIQGQGLTARVRTAAVKPLHSER